MIIFIECILLIIVVIVLGKMLYHSFLKKKLYSLLYTYSTKEKEEVNENYLKVRFDKDINEMLQRDLELEQLFSIINHTYTRVGQEYMHAQMFIDNQDHEQLEAIIKALENENQLKEVLYRLYQLSRAYSSSLNFFLSQSFLSPLSLILMFCSTLIFIGLLMSCFFNAQMLAFVFIWCAVLSAMYTHYNSKTQDMMSECMSYWYVVDCLQKLNQLSIFSKEESQEIERMVAKSKRYTRISRIIQVISYVDIFYFTEFIKAMFFIPIYQCYILLKNKDVLFDDYLKMYEYVGKVDMAVSLIVVRNHFQTCAPQISHEPILSMREGYHPIIKDPVKNSFSTSSSCLITGSNASGKSTFLKTVGINMIMAKAYHTCFADEFIYYPYQLCSSIHVQDDLKGGESYYIREIKTLKMILDEMKTKKCMILIDEILRGTNEKERIAISKVILDYMFQSDSLIIVTTHDLSIVDYFSDIDKYCFNDRVENDLWQSDYKIRKGVCTIGNAIRLLEVYDFDEKIQEQLKKPI